MTVVRKIYKYATGQAVPEGARFISTVVQEFTTSHDQGIATPERREELLMHHRLVWHYYEVEVDE